MSTNIHSTRRSSLKTSDDTVTPFVRLDRHRTKLSVQLPGGWQESTNSYRQAPEPKAPSLFAQFLQDLAVLVGSPKAKALDQTCQTGLVNNARQAPPGQPLVSRLSVSLRPATSNKSYHADIDTSHFGREPFMCQSPASMDFPAKFDLPAHAPLKCDLPRRRPAIDHLAASRTKTPSRSKKSLAQGKVSKRDPSTLDAQKTVECCPGTYQSHCYEPCEPTAPKTILKLRDEGKPSPTKRQDLKGVPVQKTPSSEPGVAKPACSVSSPSKSPKRPRNGVTCSAFTSKGKPCENFDWAGKPKELQVKAGPLCRSHAVVETTTPKENGKLSAMRPHGEPIPSTRPKHEAFQSAAGEWVLFSKFIKENPSSHVSLLSKKTKAKLRKTMQAPLSESEETGFIYCYQILRDDDPGYVHLKVGRSGDPGRRLPEWNRQCGEETILKGWFPSLPDANWISQSLLFNIDGGFVVPSKNTHVLEKLIHTQLEGFAEKRFREECQQCGKTHREIFTFKTSDVKCNDPWEYLVKPVIECWYGYVNEHT